MALKAHTRQIKEDIAWQTRALNLICRWQGTYLRPLNSSDLQEPEMPVRKHLQSVMQLEKGKECTGPPLKWQNNRHTIGHWLDA